MPDPGPGPPPVPLAGFGEVRHHRGLRGWQTRGKAWIGLHASALGFIGLKSFQLPLLLLGKAGLLHAQCLQDRFQRKLFFSKRESVTQWVSFMQTNSPGAPLGRDIVSRAVGHPATAKPQLKSWEVVHPQAIYRELCYSYSSGRSLRPQP
ncbi:unnamed protein product [Symbiodinium natans]|uniref:Uncharacterized protein n=1 Tax=Symbiodinium natans TaxID=878477 RepID=A0A812JIJ9_9DINO|nr:unnamed protein product [Symbiodinium natans]